jgi:hypothetical protein
MSRPNPIAGVPAIPPSTPDPKGLAVVVRAIKENVELMVGQRGDTMGRAVTFNDLVALGLVTAEQVKATI